MASSGQITVYTESVDWPNYTRGAVELTNVIGWSVNDSGVISFWSISSSDNAGGTWGVCTTSTNPNEGYVIMDVQVNYGGGWQTITSSRVKRAICPTLTNAISASITCINNLGTPTLTGNCSMRILYYADLNPHPSSDLPHAFPSESYSAAVQVPVQVDVSWTATMNYNANGGTGAPSPTTGTSTAGTQTLTISNTVPTRTNYRFEGWSYSGTLYHGGDTITIAKGDPTITLTAVWEKFYRPGAVLDGNSLWVSHDRDSGACQILSDTTNMTWKECRTIDGNRGGQGDPPLILHADNANSWYNQKKLGKE